MPMHRCIASAAGGASQRLKRGPATMFSRSKNPAAAVVVAAFIRSPFVVLRFLEVRPDASSRRLVAAYVRRDVAFLLPLTLPQLGHLPGRWWNPSVRVPGIAVPVASSSPCG